MGAATSCSGAHCQKGSEEKSKNLTSSAYIHKFLAHILPRNRNNTIWNQKKKEKYVNKEKESNSKLI